MCSGRLYFLYHDLAGNSRAHSWLDDSGAVESDLGHTIVLGQVVVLSRVLLASNSGGHSELEDRWGLPSS